jgi:hypothetical protein
MKVHRSHAPLAAIVAVAVLVSACRTLNNDDFTFDAAAHQRALALKSRSLALMASSGEAYSRHSQDAEALTAEMENAYQLSAAAPDNELVIVEWEAMKDPERGLYGGFVRRWQASGTIDAATRDLWMDKVTVRFNYIICLEAAKKTKAGRCTPPEADATASPPAADATASPPA